MAWRSGQAWARAWASAGTARAVRVSTPRVRTPKTSEERQRADHRQRLLVLAGRQVQLWASVGSTSAATASISSVAIIRGASPPKRSTPCRQPPARKARPRTRSALLRIEPISEACTTVTRPARSAKMQTKSSGRLPTADWTMPVAAAPR